MSVRSRRSRGTIPSPFPTGSWTGSASSFACLGTAPILASTGGRGEPAPRGQPRSPLEGGRRRVTSLSPLSLSRASDRLPGSPVAAAPCAHLPAGSGRGCPAKAPRRSPRRAMKPGGFASAARAASGPPARAPWRGEGCGGGRVPGRPSGTGTAPDHFCPQRSFTQEHAAAAPAIFRGLKIAAAFRPANQGTRGSY